MSEIEGVATYDDLPEKKTEFVEIEEPKEKVEEEEKKPEVEKVKEKVVDLTLAQKKEDEARRHGWRPLEEWKGDPLEWRNPEVFLERGKYFNIMKDQKVKIDSLETKIDGMAKYQKDLRSAERQKVLKELAEQKVEALENEEFVKVVAIDDKINEERSAAMNDAVEEQVPTPTPVQSPEDAAAWDRFVGVNGWYTSDPKKRMYADAIGIDYKTNNPYAPVSEILTYVQEEVQLRFDSVVSTVQPASPVDTSSSRGSHSTRVGGKKKMTVNDLTPMELEMGQTFVDQGAFDSIDEYVASLEEIGGLE